MRAQNRFEQSFKKGALVTPSPILLAEHVNLDLLNIKHWLMASVPCTSALLINNVDTNVHIENQLVARLHSVNFLESTLMSAFPGQLSLIMSAIKTQVSSTLAGLRQIGEFIHTETCKTVYNRLLRYFMGYFV